MVLLHWHHVNRSVTNQLTRFTRLQGLQSESLLTVARQAHQEAEALARQALILSRAVALRGSTVDVCSVGDTNEDRDQAGREGQGKGIVKDASSGMELD